MQLDSFDNKLVVDQGYLPPGNGGPPSGSYGPPSDTYGPPNGGNGNGNKPPPVYGPPEDATEPAKYSFEWEVNDPESGNEYGQKEERDGDNTVGSYNVLLPDGRKQIVEYTVDKDGYHPVIKYEGGKKVYYQFFNQNSKSFQQKNHRSETKWQRWWISIWQTQRQRKRRLPLLSDTPLYIFPHLRKEYRLVSTTL